MEISAKIDKTKQQMIYTIIVMLLCLFWSTYLHELGHGIIGMISGGKISYIKMGFNPRIGIIGANYNSYTLPLMNVFGYLFPFLITTLLIITYNKRIKNQIYHLFVFFMFLNASFSTLPWIIISLFFTMGLRPENDDVTKFLMNCNIDNRLVALIFLLAFLGILMLGLKYKKIHSPIVKMYKDLKKEKNKSNLN